MTRSIRRQLLALAALAMVGTTAQGAIVYQLKTITLNTSSAPGTYTFGAGALAASACITCGPGGSLLTDDGAGNLTVDQLQYRLSNFGGDFIHTFSGTSTLGTTSLIKGAGETCVDGPLAGATPHLCSSTDQRGLFGNWYNGLLPDGTTAAPTRQFQALVSGNNLTLRFRVNRDATPFDDFDWLQYNFNYQVVPVPAAVWLFGSAIGVLGVARRRSLAAKA